MRPLHGIFINISIFHLILMSSGLFGLCPQSDNIHCHPYENDPKSHSEALAEESIVTTRFYIYIYSIKFCYFLPCKAFKLFYGYFYYFLFSNSDNTLKTLFNFKIFI